jgi:uncharacterized Fe-S center protein
MSTMETTSNCSKNSNCSTENKEIKKMNKKELLSKLWQHLLDLNKGFAFSYQSKRIYTSIRNFLNLDLEMYNVKLKGMVLINVHTGKLKSDDLIKMQKLVDHYNNEFKYTHENPTIGIIINHSKNGYHVTYVGVPDLQKKNVEKSLLLDELN